MIYSCMSSEATTKGIAEQLAEQHRVSTDPKWPPEEMNPQNGEAGTAKPEGQASPPVDGRNRRHTTTHNDILAACRTLMLDGVFRPSMAEVCELARRAERSGFQHFGTIEKLRLLVLEMPDVVEAIGALTHARSPAEIARLVVLGRI